MVSCCCVSHYRPLPAPDLAYNAIQELIDAGVGITEISNDEQNRFLNFFFGYNQTISFTP